MDSWNIIILISCLFAPGAWGQALAWTTPASGDAAGGTAIAESATTATTAETLAATGGTSPYTYAIVSVDGDTTAANWKFEISTAALQCKASQSFDYETKKKYVIIVTAVDAVPATITGTVTVMLSDVDDNDSTWVTTCGAASSDALLNDVVGNFAVCDADVNSAITYAITSGDDAGSAKFAIANTGVMTKTAAAFDGTKTSYALVVEARGVVKTSTATINVSIGGTCTCPGSGSGSSGLSFGLFTLFAAFVLQKI